MLNEIDLINFIDLNLEEKKMILSWRNSTEIKKWMFTNNDITLNHHLSFIESLKISKDKLYFVVKKNELYLGVINLTTISNNTKNCEFGLYSNLELKGIGKILLDITCNYAFDKLDIKVLHAEVFQNNTRAISLYENFGFKKVSQKITNDKKVICLELKHENW